MSTTLALKSVLRNIRRTLWVFALTFTSVLFLSRFILAAFCRPGNESNTLFSFLGCLVLLYVSFLIEGIVLATAKIEDYDENATIDAMLARHGPSDSLGANLVKIKRKSTKILVGQPLLAIAVTFTFNWCLELSNLDNAQVCEYVPGRLATLYQGGLVTIVLSTMLIYWFSQILPQSLGKVSSIEFMRFVGALRIADLLALVAKTEVGFPGTVLERGVKYLGFTKEPLKLPLGDSNFFEAMSTDYDKYIETRHILIEQIHDAVFITDSSRVIYLTKKRKIDHIFRVARSQYDEDHGVDIKLEVPERTKSEEAEPKQLFSYMLDKDITRTVEAQEGEDMVSMLWGETIFTIASSSDEYIPYINVVAKYKYKKKDSNRFTTSSADSDVLYFDTGIPTRRVDITIKFAAGEFITDADLRFVAEEARIFDSADEIRRGRSNTIRAKDEWRIIHDHPPLADDMKLTVDVRRERPSNGSGQSGGR